MYLCKDFCNKTEIFSLLCLMTGLGMAFVWKEILFPSSFQPSLEAIIVSAVPGKSNMFWHYSDIYPSVTLEFLFSKFLIAAKKHLFSVQLAPFYLFTNIAILCAILSVVTGLRKNVVYIVPIFMFIGLYAGMIILQQNHPRYQQIVAPVIFFTIMLALSGVLKEHLKRVVIPLCGVLVIVNCYMVHEARVESISESQDIESIVDVANQYGIHQKWLSVDVYPHNPISYALAPREFLSIRTDLLDYPKIERAVELFDPLFIISSQELGTTFLSRPIEYLDIVASTLYNGNLYLYKF